MHQEEDVFPSPISNPYNNEYDKRAVSMPFTVTIDIQKDFDESPKQVEENAIDCKEEDTRKAFKRKQSIKSKYGSRAIKK